MVAKSEDPMVAAEDAEEQEPSVVSIALRKM